MSYVWLTDLDQALAAAGIAFVEIGEHPNDATGASDWRSRGRPYSTGDFEPSGVLCHHTASPEGTSDEAELNVILWGNSDAPGPISQLFIGRGGTVYLVAAGRANHAGSASIDWVGDDCDGNAHLIGIEVSNDGVGERWADDLCAVYARVASALCSWYGWGLDRITLHGVTGPPAGNHKIDPAGPGPGQPELPGGGAGTWDLGVWRDFIAATGPATEDEMTDNDWARMEQIVNEGVIRVLRGEEAQAIIRDVCDFSATLSVVRSDEFRAIVRESANP
jgi:hypothetical protein